MKAQNGLKFPSELCFGIMNAAKDSYLLNSKVAFLKSGQNAAGICPFFYGADVLQPEHLSWTYSIRYSRVFRYLADSPSHIKKLGLAKFQKYRFVAGFYLIKSSPFEKCPLLRGFPLS